MSLVWVAQQVMTIKQENTEEDEGNGSEVAQYLSDHTSPQDEVSRLFQQFIRGFLIPWCEPKLLS